MEEYLTVDELGVKIKFSKQSLYNLIHKGTFVLGKHYLKPSPKKVLFKWSEIQIWMGEFPCSNSDVTTEKGDEATTNEHSGNTLKNKIISSINI